jgi:hypothetical protein
LAISVPMGFMPMIKTCELRIRWWAVWPTVRTVLLCRIENVRGHKVTQFYDLKNPCEGFTSLRVKQCG